MPATIGDTSPAVTATIASSSIASPSGTRPALTSMWPWMCSASANKSASANRRAIAAASPATSPPVVEVALHLVAEDRWQAEVAALHAVRVLLADEPLRPSDPARPAPHLAGQQELHPRPERAARGEQRSTRVEVALVRAPEDVDVDLEAPEHVRRGRQPLEVARLQPVRRVRARQGLIRTAPLAPLAQGAAALELADGGHADALTPTWRQVRSKRSSPAPFLRLTRRSGARLEPRSYVRCTLRDRTGAVRTATKSRGAALPRPV